MSLYDEIDRFVQKIEGKLANLFRRGELSRVDQDFMTQGSGFADEQYDDVELWQHYGLASRPPIGSEVLLAHLGGYGENAIAFATSNRDNRPQDLEEEETVLFGKKSTGQPQVRLTPSGNVNLIPATGKTVNVGDAAATEYIIKGTTFASSFAGLSAATDPATTMALVNALLAALKTTPLSTKAKVG